MTPPIFPTVNVPAVRALLGVAPLRFYSFGRAPQDVAYPYAVWQQVFGSPENNLSAVPQADTYTTQIDVYAKPTPDGGGAALVRQIAQALRDAIEPTAHVVAWRGETRDSETGNFVFSMDVDWVVPR